MDYAKLVIDLLSVNGWTEKELADRVGVSQPTINRIRNDKSWPTRDTAQKLLGMQHKAKRKASR